ncbi:MAG: 2-amino-4-hydroxy-6-hydroxymethyldihydropteridine diphosphokinase [Spartobacteria bacterium]
MRAAIALGANLRDRHRCLTTARARLFALPRVTPPLLSSSLYETEPVDCEPGAKPFLNAVVEIGYAGSSRQLLEELQKIEASLGRPPAHARNRSRPIDLDLLYHGAKQLSKDGLQLPHPRLHLRGFVLHPLAEIRPGLLLPGHSRTVAELAGQLPAAPAVVQSARQW